MHAWFFPYTARWLAKLPRDPESGGMVSLSTGRMRLLFALLYMFCLDLSLERSVRDDVPCVLDK
jgi:hypothetical protein